MKKVSFEDKMKELEQIVNELESGDLTLDDTIKKFENGMKISKDCSQMLENAEKKITILLENDNNIEEENFTRVE